MDSNENAFFESDKIDINMLKMLEPKMIISYNYKYLISEEVIQYMHNKIINLHISYLPWNRGSDPNFWSFIENTPKGITIHKIDQGLDTGNILIQKEVEFDEEQETFLSAYETLNLAVIELLKDNWDAIRAGDIIGTEQRNSGSYHKRKDFLGYMKGEKINWDQRVADFKRRKID